MGESETTFGSKLWEELDDRGDVACWGLQQVSFFQRLVHTHAVCLYLSRMRNDHDQGFSQVHLERGTWANRWLLIPILAFPEAFWTKMEKGSYSANLDHRNFVELPRPNKSQSLDSRLCTQKKKD